MLKPLIVLGLSSLLLVACGKGEDTKPAEQPAPAVEAPATPVAPADEPAPEPEAAADGDDSDAVPTAADFEEEATTTITAETLEAELKRLEEEIGAVGE